MKKKITQLELLMEYYIENPDRDIPHSEIVDWATSEWYKRTGTVFRDPDRGIRRLHQEGKLIKVRKGVYRYSENIHGYDLPVLENFSQRQKRKILERDNYKCVVCGRGEKEGVELHVDHIKPRDLGGKAIIENGQTLCAQHNHMKKNLRHTEAAKNLFIRMYKLAEKGEDENLMKFCSAVLELYDRYGINGHIEWKK